MTYRDFISSFSLDRRIPLYYTLLTSIFLYHLYQFFSLSSIVSSTSTVSPTYQLLSSTPNNLQPWYLYVSILSFFHLGEYTLTAWYQPQRVTIDSFLLNHSPAYHIAIVIAVIEYWCEYYYLHHYNPLPYFTVLKTSSTSILFYLGTFLTFGGQCIRILAMATAGSNFSHLIVDTKQSSHQLVTHGIYRYLRHPAYTGWFYWSIGTQCVLSNPVCILLYGIVSWKFFADRIPYEEYTLLQFFGWDYVQYAQSSYICIPAIQSPAYEYRHPVTEAAEEEKEEKKDNGKEVKEEATKEETRSRKR